MNSEVPPFVEGDPVHIINDNFDNLSSICETVNIIGVKLPVKDKIYTVRDCVDLGYAFGIRFNEIRNKTYKFGNKIMEPMFIHDRLEKTNYDKNWAETI